MQDINFWGAANMTRLAIPYLRNTGGKIAVVSSAAAWLPVPRHTIYNVSRLINMYTFFTA